ncbi:MAG: DUF1517 domain-containing protein [Deltaproteobacteria bacterium]|nr:MAG: DUF1517 domain-containing protein [Deltaproteobacteria bacterium]
MRHRLRTWIVAFISLFLIVPVTTSIVIDFGRPQVAEARSGGSGGGFRRSFGGGGGSRSFGGGGSRSRSYGSGGGYSSGGSSGIGTYMLLRFLFTPTGMVVVGVIAVFFFVVPAIKNANERKRQAKLQAISVGRVQLAFDAMSTVGLRDRIEGIVREADVGSSMGIWRMGQQVLTSVLGELDHVSFAAFTEEKERPPEIGEEAFHRLTNDARSMFEREIVRRDQKGLALTQRNSDKATDLLDEDGDFGIAEYFIVTLVTAAQAGPIGLPETLGPQEDVENALKAMYAIGPDRHVGFEVVWTPAAESDILTRDELLTDYPQLAPL